MLLIALMQQSCCVDIVTTIAGTGAGGYSGDNGLATSASLHGASAVVVDSLGNIFIADRSNSCIRKVTVSTGIITTIAGTGSASYSGDNSQATAAGLNIPHKIGVDSSGITFILYT
jgi:hypothetical protein